MKYTGLVEEYEKSGMTQKQFASKKGISPSMVHYYINKSKQDKDKGKDQAPKLSSIEVTDVPSGNIKIIMPNGVHIEIPI